ncbi:transposase [Xanthomonas arboricola]|uniref:transposase n=1 Tax=Xanthomonas arboricola TaxID=56448 RepID=UPI0021571787|nr:transposase [Xanthomonas arboricola]
MGRAQRHRLGLHRAGESNAKRFYRTLQRQLPARRAGHASLPHAVSEVCEQTEHWLADYNQQIPHDSLGGLTPAEFLDQ